MDFPIITICIITYRRPKEIRRTMDALLKQVNYPRDRLRWLIADDSSGGTYITDLQSTPRYQTLNIECSTTPVNSGWGANANTALEYIARLHTDSEFIFFIEDDYLLRKPLDLRVGAALMMQKPEIGMLRYRGTAGTHLVLHQLEADISDYLPDYQDGVGVSGKVTYCLIDGNSPSLYIYSHGCHLKRLSFHHFYGLYPEGIKLGHTEESYAHMVKDGMKRKGAPCVAILPEWIALQFDHIGVSYQHTEEDKGN